MSIGMWGHLMLAEESSYGAEATPTATGEILSEDLTMANNLIRPDYVNNVGEKFRTLLGNLDVGGQISFDLTPEGIMGWVLKAMFGEVSTSTVDTGVYDHVYTPSTISPSYTIEIDRQASVMRFLGCKASSMDISIAQGELLTCNVDWISQQPKIVASGETPNFSTLDPFTAYDVEVTLNGTSYTIMESLNLTINREAEGKRTLNNQRYISGITQKMFDSSGSFTLEYDDDEQFQRALGNSSATTPQKTQTANTLTITITSQEVITGSYKYTLTIEFPEVYYESADAPISGPNDRMIQTVNFFPQYSQSDGYGVQVTLRNSEASYPDA